MMIFIPVPIVYVNFQNKGEIRMNIKTNDIKKGTKIKSKQLNAMGW